VAILGAWLALGQAAAAAQSGVALKVSLQAAMQRHIDRTAIDGAYLHLNGATGEIRRLYPVAAHPAIMRVGEYFVLCADFLDEAGEKVNVDFYLAPRGSEYVVFADEVDNPELLATLREAGRLERLE
jgi:hypothetical protein